MAEITGLCIEIQMKQAVKKIILSALILCMAAAFVPTAAFAASGESSTITVSAASANQKSTIDGFTYSDDYFSLDCNEYHHELAQLSSGLTYASSRLKTETYAGDFLSAIGFTDLDLTAYETLPSADTIANCIGSKKIGDTTVIAVGICGANYEKEWASNLTVGNGERSQGFDEAAQQVIERINDYIDRYQITGSRILWVTGYSRSAATANIVAADMTDSGKFTKVFAYTFATPRTTRDKGNYTNIFNILSKDDVVPKVPVPEWGYERYGRDLYLPAQEFDTNYPALAYEAYNAIPEADFTNNTELADDFRTVMGYLYEFLPDTDTYVSLMQDKMREIIISGETDDVLEILLQIANDLTPENEAQEKEQEAFIAYMDKLIAKYVLYGNQAQVDKNQWLVQKGIGGNLFNEHGITTYISWMLSGDTGEGLYSDNLEFIHLTLNTEADVSILHGDDPVQTIRYDGSADYTGTGYTENDIYLAYTRNQKQVTIDLPLDSSYTVTYTPAEDEAGNMIAVKYSAAKVEPAEVFSTILNTEAGVPCVLQSSGNGQLQLVTEGLTLADTQILSAAVPMSIVTTLENINVLNLSVYQLVYVWMIAIGALILQLILHIALSVYRKRTGKRRSERNKDVTFFVNIILMTVLEIEVWYYAPSLPYINETAFLICSIMMIVYALGGKNKLWVIAYGMILAVFLVLSYFYTGTISPAGIAVLAVKQILLTSVAWLIRKKSLPSGRNRAKAQ